MDEREAKNYTVYRENNEDDMTILTHGELNMNNPYIGIIKSIRGTNQQSYIIGEVISTSPLQIAYNGIVLGSGYIHSADPQLSWRFGLRVQDRRFIVLCKITEVE